jgi:general L-amino acid transport system permease protein
LKPGSVPWWRAQRTRDLLFQIVLLVVVAAIIGGMALNARAALDRQHIASGFGFLDNTAGFDIVQTLVRYDETSTYGRVLLVGVLNTMLVAAIGIVLATMLGFVIGIGQLSSNWLVARLCRVYVEIIRNLPLLLQLRLRLLRRLLPHLQPQFLHETLACLRLVLFRFYFMFGENI